MIGGLTYLQYQAGQAGAWAVNIFGQAKDVVGGTASGVYEGAGGVWERLGRGWDKTREDVSGVNLKVEMPT